MLAGIGALAIPEVGPLIAAGPIMATLAGLGVGGAVGGMVGALVGMGIPEYEAKRYEGRVKDGGILVSVHCDTSEEVSPAKDVLKECGGEDIASAGEKAVGSHGVTDPDQTQRSRAEIDTPTRVGDVRREDAKMRRLSVSGSRVAQPTRQRVWITALVL